MLPVKRPTCMAATGAPTASDIIANNIKIKINHDFIIGLLLKLLVVSYALSSMYKEMKQQQLDPCL